MSPMKRALIFALLALAAAPAAEAQRVTPITHETFGSTANLGSAQNDAVTYANDGGYGSIGFQLDVPAGATVAFECTKDGSTWAAHTVRKASNGTFFQTTTADDAYVANIALCRSFRVRVSSAGSGTGTVAGIASSKEGLTDPQGRTMVRADHSESFSCSVSSATADTECKAAGAAGISYYIQTVTVSNGGTAQTVLLEEGTGSACASNAATLVPNIFLPVNGSVTIPVNPPIKTTAARAICCDISGTTAFSCSIQGYAGP